MWSPHVGQAAVEGVADQVAVAADAAGERDELRDARVRRPRQPPGQQVPALGQGLGKVAFQQLISSLMGR